MDLDEGTDFDKTLYKLQRIFCCDPKGNYDIVENTDIIIRFRRIRPLNVQKLILDSMMHLKSKKQSKIVIGNSVQFSSTDK